MLCYFVIYLPYFVIFVITQTIIYFYIHVSYDGDYGER